MDQEEGQPEPWPARTGRATVKSRYMVERWESKRSRSIHLLWREEELET